MTWLRKIGTLPQWLREIVDRFGERTALAWTKSRGGSGLTYRELLERATAGAGALRELGLRPGDRVLLAVEPRPEWFAAFLAIVDAGLVVVPTLPEISKQQLATVAAHADVAAIIVGEAARGVSEALPAIPSLNVPALFHHSASSSDPATHDPDAVAMIAFTSGSTARPRGVTLTHRNLLSDLAAVMEVRQVKPKTVVFSVLPPAHLFELTGGLLGALSTGARVVYPGPPLPNRIVEALESEQVTHALIVPALLDAVGAEVMAELIEMGVVDPIRRHQSISETARRLEELATDDLEAVRAGVRSRIGHTLRKLIVGGAAVDPAWAEVLAQFGIIMEVGYGLTEASPIISMGQVPESPAGSVGRPLPGIRVRIDSDGEILVRGETVMQGYWKDTSASAAALRDGWLHTGDRGYLDAAGNLFVTGRIKEAMVTDAGETIYPDEVEPYYESPLFKEICVTGLRGESGNDRPTLFVVTSSEVTSGELESTFARLRAGAPARFRLQECVQLTRALPRTASGKVQRRNVALDWEEQPRDRR